MSVVPGRIEKPTFCRICEPLCGLIATVEDGRLTKLRPDQDHPISQGYACPKGILMTEIVYDPDRLLYPLRRKSGTPPGPASPDQFECVGWDEALRDIGGRLRKLIDRHGGDSIGCYIGQAGFFSYSAPMFVQGLLDAVGSPHAYSSASQDASSRMAACALVYGSSLVVPIPDLYRTSFLLVLGANPLVSNGSLLSGKHLRNSLNAIVSRGGRILVVDPRRSETAAAFEHLPIRPNSDAWMLLSILNVIFSEGLEDKAAIAAQASGAEDLRKWCAPYPPEATAALTGITPDALATLARELATAETAAVYGRCGTNRGSHPTLVAFLIEALNLVTGNLDRAGGWLIGSSPVPDAFQKDFDTYGKKHSRVGDFPDVFGFLPAGVIGKEMLRPGKGQIRGFFTIAGNPLLSVPGGHELSAAMAGLELNVAIDLYLNETAQHADYVLPATTFLEREDITLLAAQPWHLTPHIQWSDPVIARRGEVRTEAEIIAEIARHAGVEPYGSKLMRFFARRGRRMSPSTQVDLALRLGRYGDMFGVRRSGLNLAKIRTRARGVILSEQQPTGVLKSKLRHPDKRARLNPPQIGVELMRMAAKKDQVNFPLALIGMRELRSLNSWMHNAPKLMAGARRHSARIHPDDAAKAGIVDGAEVRIVSITSSIQLPANITAEVLRGTVAIPHGWGHSGGWTLARRNHGANVNLLASTEVADFDPLSGTPLLDGIPIRIEAVQKPALPNTEAS